MEILPRRTARRIGRVYTGALKSRVKGDYLWPDRIRVYLKSEGLLIVEILVTTTKLNKGRLHYYRAFQLTREFAADLVDAHEIALVAKFRAQKRHGYTVIARTRLRKMMK